MEEKVSINGVSYLVTYKKRVPSTKHAWHLYLVHDDQRYHAIQYGPDAFSSVSLLPVTDSPHA